MLVGGAGSRAPSITIARGQSPLPWGLSSFKRSRLDAHPLRASRVVPLPGMLGASRLRVREGPQPPLRTDVQNHEGRPPRLRAASGPEGVADEVEVAQCEADFGADWCPPRAGVAALRRARRA